MVTTSQQFPTLMKEMNAAANTAKSLAMASVDAAKMEAFYLKFFRQGGKLSSLSFTDQDYEPGGPMAHWPEGRPLPEQNFHEGYSLKLTSNHFGGQFLYSFITHIAGKAELLNSGPKMLAQSEADTRETLAHQLLVWGATALASIQTVNGIPMVNPICGDGLTLFNASHRWRSNSAILNSNVLTDYYHPTQTGVNKVNKQIARWRDANGKPLMVRVRGLLVPVELELLVQVFKASDKDPLTDTNAANMFNKLVPDGYIADPWLPSTSDWFFLTNVTSQRPQIRELLRPDIEAIPYDRRTRDSGVSMATSYAMGPSVHGWMSIGRVSGTPSDVANSLT